MDCPNCKKELVLSEQLKCSVCNFEFLGLLESLLSKINTSTTEIEAIKKSNFLKVDYDEAINHKIETTTYKYIQARFIVVTLILAVFSFLGYTNIVSIMRNEIKDQVKNQIEVVINQKLESKEINDKLAEKIDSSVELQASKIIDQKLGTQEINNLISQKAANVFDQKIRWEIHENISRRLQETKDSLDSLKRDHHQFRGDLDAFQNMLNVFREKLLSDSNK